ncbi:MAG: P83/100 family protein [Treponemataceae bacterium]
MFSEFRYFSTRARNSVVASVLFFLLVSSVSAIEVDRAELEKSGKERIVFINYEGPHATIDTTEDIFGIGLALGKAVKNGAIKAGDPQRYYAVHSVAPKSASPAGLDADVIALGIDAGVDHINNLRLILRGFLQGAYDYSSKDAALLAEFATVYNAVHRGDWAYYEKQYKASVVLSLDKEKVGLSVRFDEWPGRAMIVIPLSDGAKPGSLSAVDTTPLTDKKVVDELRKKDDSGIESRKEMVDLKEREASAAKQKAALEREAIVDEEKKLAEEKAKLQADKDRLAAEREKARKAEEDAAKKAGQSGDAKTGVADTAKETTAKAGEGKSEPEKATITETKKALDEKEKAVAEKEKAIAEKETAIAEKKTEAAKSESLAEKKEKEAQADRKDIAQDQQKAIKKEEAAVVQPTGEAALKMISNDGPLARFVLVDLNTGKELKSSALDTVRSRSVAAVGERIVAIAGKTGGTGAVRLVLVDKKSLEMIKQGDDDILSDSPVWVNGENIYALTVISGALKLGLFDKDLKKKALSDAKVHPFTALRFASGVVIIQTENGSPLLLKDSDLTVATR